MLLEFNRCSDLAMIKNMRGTEAGHRPASRVVLLLVVISFGHPVLILLLRFGFRSR